jgi:hypothetical protein
MSLTMIGVIGLIIISAVSGWFFSRTKKVEKPVKVMLFVLYFWISFFILLMVFAGLYYFGAWA